MTLTPGEFESEQNPPVEAIPPAFGNYTSPGQLTSQNEEPAPAASSLLLGELPGVGLGDTTESAHSQPTSFVADGHDFISTSGSEPTEEGDQDSTASPAMPVAVVPTYVFPTSVQSQMAPSSATTTSSDKKSSSTRTAIIAGVLSGLLAGIGSFAVASSSNFGSHSSIVLPSTHGDTSPRPDGSIAGIAAKVLPTVVSISVTSPTASGTGSGFIIRSDSNESYILTNNHVASGAGVGSKIVVNFQDESQEDATVVGTDSSYDLAVIKIERGNLPVAQLGNSDDVVVGDATIAVGSPLGLSGTVTSGIVSALNRPVTAGDQTASSFINAIQTDAAINPGNSGGPLLNAVGQVIGVNSAIASLGGSLGGQTGNIGLGFAIPINQAKRVAEELMKTGTSTHPVVGISIDMAYVGLGAKIASITPGGPASKSDLKTGDIVTGIDGHRIADGAELVVRIRAHAAGDTVTLNRKGGSDVQVVLGSEATK
ncbi:MAG: trypsin-like peptidase domain-containing protein [Actinomycetes bacterium]